MLPGTALPPVPVRGAAPVPLPGFAVLNEFLLRLFLPGITVFVGLWAALRLVLDWQLRSVWLPTTEPAHGAGLFASGFGRFLLLIVFTAIILLPSAVVYARFVRGPLRERGLV